jgi:hypothetical protein
MLGVLLATARPGQRAPGARQTVNLVACGLAIRARRALGSLADETWQDALAVVSLIAPVLMLVIAALDFALAIREAMVENHAYPAAGPFWSPWLVPFLGGPATVMIGWLAVVLLGLTGPRRGLAIVGRRQACLMIAALSGVFGVPAIVLMVRSSVPVAPSTVSLLDISVLTIAVAVVVTHVRHTVDRRVAALIAPVLLVDAASIPFEFEGISTATVVLSLASLLFALLVWPAAIAFWRGRVRRSSHALPA